MKVTLRETRPGEVFLGGSGILVPFRMTAPQPPAAPTQPEPSSEEPEETQNMATLLDSLRESIEYLEQKAPESLFVERLQGAVERLRSGAGSVGGRNVLQRQSRGPDMPASNRRSDAATWEADDSKNGGSCSQGPG